MIGPEYQKWVCKIMGFDFEIQYKVGRLNRAVDALSRRLDLVECATMVTLQWRDWDKLKGRNRIKWIFGSHQEGSDSGYHNTCWLHSP